MKKILAIILVLATLLALVACKKEYEPRESTEEEARVVMTFTMDGKEYEVKYELYRALFLTYKSLVDGGNSDVWTGDSKDVYVERINAMILDRAAEIYAAFAICKKIGFDPYSSDVEDEIRKLVKISVEGGDYDGEPINGHDSYDAYLEYLKSTYLNYSVAALMHRYLIATNAINEYYIGTARADDVNYDISLGNIEYTKNDVKEFFLGDDCAMILRGSYLKGLSYDPEEKIAQLRENIEQAINGASTIEAKETAVFNRMMGENIYTGDVVIGKYDKYNPKATYFGEIVDAELADAAIGLDEGALSDPISTVSASGEYYTLIYKTYKSEEYFEENYDNIRYVYLTNYVGKITADVIESLKAGVSYSDLMSTMNHSEIGM